MTVHMWCADEGGGRGNIGGKKVAQVCAWNYYGAQFIAPSRGLIPSPSPNPGPDGNWEGELLGSCKSITSLPRLNVTILLLLFNLLKYDTNIRVLKLTFLKVIQIKVDPIHCKIDHLTPIVARWPYGHLNIFSVTIGSHQMKTSIWDIGCNYC